LVSLTWESLIWESRFSDNPLSEESAVWRI
jgi:hypothetical protein